MENTQINMSLLLAYAPELVETLRSALEWDEKSNEGHGRNGHLKRKN